MPQDDTPRKSPKMVALPDLTITSYILKFSEVNCFLHNRLLKSWPGGIFTVHSEQAPRIPPTGPPQRSNKIDSHQRDETCALFVNECMTTPSHSCRIDYDCDHDTKLESTGKEQEDKQQTSH